MSEAERESLAIGIIMEEYKTLRQELLLSVSNRLTIIIYSFGAATLIFSAIVVSKLPDIIVSIALGFFVPLITRTISRVWIAEYERSLRAGAAIAILEGKINKRMTEDGLLGWETNVRANNQKLSYQKILQLPLHLGYASEFISIYFFAKSCVGLRWQLPKMLSLPYVGAHETNTYLLASVVLFSAIVAISEFASQRSVNGAYKHARRHLVSSNSEKAIAVPLE
jgi:hypothetical protein